MSGNRTILTEVKSYLVDAVSKIPVFRQTVSTKVEEGDEYVSEDFMVVPGHPRVIENVSKLFSLNTWSPVELSLTQIGPVSPPDPDPEIPSYLTGVIRASNFVAGQPIAITVEDGDIPVLSPTVRVVVYNVNTGETEQLYLAKQSAGIYSGSIPTEYGPTAGINFDGTLVAGHNHSIRLIYQDQRSTNGIPTNVEHYVVASSPYVDSELVVNQFLYPGRPVAIFLRDRDLAGTGFQTCVVTNMMTSEVEEITLLETAEGIFTAALPTTGNVTPSPVSGDGIIEVSIGDNVRVEFMDGSSAHAVALHTALSEVRPEGYTNGIISLPNNVSPDSSTALTFFDYDLAGQGIIDIAVNNLRTGEFEYVRCTESVNGSGSFFGILHLTSAASVSDDHVLNVIVGDTIRAVYIDLSPESGPTLTVVREALVVPKIAEEEEEEIPDPDEDDGGEDDPDVPEFVPQTVTLVSNGLFAFNGNFNGSVSISAIDKAVRCKLIYV